MGRELKQTNGLWAVHETVSESEYAITPGFAEKADLVKHLSGWGTECDDPWSKEQAEYFVNESGWAPSGIAHHGEVPKGYEVLPNDATEEPKCNS